VKNGVDKDIYLVVGFMELKEYHCHTLHENVVKPPVSQILDDVCGGPYASLDGFLVSLSITCIELNWEIILECPLFNNFFI
jgi:hypothetical protein